MPSATGTAVVLTAPEELAVTTYPTPTAVDPGGLLVKTELATVCGSDVHTWKGHRPHPTPAILGHEIVGEIVELGDDVSRDTVGAPLAAGDRVTWTLMASCGTCYYCRTKHLPQKCEALFKYGHERSDEPPHFTGGFGEYVYVRPGTCVFKVPDGLSAAVTAPLMCGGATVAGGLEAIGVDPMDTVVVQGAGLLGLYAIPLAKAYGAGQVVAVDLDEDRLALARRFGADHTFNARSRSTDALVGEIERLTDGRGADVAVEATGTAEAIPVGVDLLATGGRYLLHGTVFPDAPFTLDGYDVVTKHVTLRGVHNYDAPHLGTVLQFVETSRDRYLFDALSGPTFPLTETGVEDALRALDTRDAIRPVVRP